MEWTADDLATLMMRTPELGPSLLRTFATKLYDADSRIESLATDQISQRLVKVLLRLGNQFGTYDDTMTLHLMPLTHELLARYVGTSREIITQHMSQLRPRRHAGLFAFGYRLQSRRAEKNAACGVDPNRAAKAIERYENSPPGDSSRTRKSRKVGESQRLMGASPSVKTARPLDGSSDGHILTPCARRSGRMSI